VRGAAIATALFFSAALTDSSRRLPHRRQAE